MVWKEDDKDALDKVQTIVETVLDTIDYTSLVFLNSLLKDLVDGEVHYP